MEALWGLDAAFGRVLGGGREPMISRIKLAWWREALEKLDRDKAPGEPLLAALATNLLPLGITGAELAEMEEGWEALLTPEALTADDLARYAAGRGGILFRLTGRLLGDATEVRAAGEAWALVDLARHSANAPDRDAALERARALSALETWPSRLRPLGMLVALARRDAERDRPQWEKQGSPGRMWRMLRHRITGR